ncbi:MAG: LysE family transporter [Chryseolinea sp.]
MASIAISFIGSLPPGTTNVITLQLASQNTHSALLFSFGCLFGEMIYVSLCVTMMNRILKFLWVLKTLEWFSFLVMLALAAASFMAAAYNVPATPRSTTTLLMEPFISGLVLILINPVQIPFWLGWTTVLYEKGLMKSTFRHRSSYVLGAGAGSLCASLLFVIAGDFLSQKLISIGELWYYILGAFFLVGAAFQFKKILSKKSLVMGRPELPGSREACHDTLKRLSN